MSRPKSVVALPEADDLSTINLCLYAHPGEGKTVLAGTSERALIMDCDSGGTLAAKQQGSTAHAVPVTDYDQLTEVYDHIRNDKHPYKWVWWDSLTLFQERVLIDDILVDAHAENPRQSEDVASQREYLINMNRIGKFIRMFADLPINFGVTCHVMISEDPSDGSVLYMPYVQGKGMPSKVSGYMNVVGYLGLKKNSSSRRLLTQRFGKFFAKDRFNALGKYVDDPTIPKLETLINKSRTKEKASSG